MRLYVNGDSHAAAAEAVNQHAFAEDDSRYFYLGRAPHPDNKRASWAQRLSEITKSTLYLDAESASSNPRIIRTTREWISRQRSWLSETLIFIQWSTWEREEWWIDDQVFQVTASGIDDVPESHHARYRNWIADMDWQSVTKTAHDDIWTFHKELEDLGARHVFFNGNNHFGNLPESLRRDWGISYIGPYDAGATYDQWLKSHGFDTVSPKSWHFGEDAHAAWSRFMLQYIMSNNLMV
jgi:hypothetical protein